MNSVLLWVAKLSIGGKLLGVVAWLHNKLDGKRSEISAGLLGLVHLLKIAGIIPEDQAKLIENALLAILPVVLADKVSKAIKAVDAVVPPLPPKPEQPAQP